MKTVLNKFYSSPEVETVELQVEQGFAESVTPTNWAPGEEDWFNF